MDKYEYRVKTDQMLECMEKKQFKKAMEIADTIDWRRVKNAAMLNSVSEVYENCAEFQKSRDILFMAYDRAPESRKIVYRLGTLALKINDVDEAADCYQEFVKLAPKDPNQYILKYKVLKARRAPVTEQIEALEEFKKAEYVEKWAYELAKLYHESGKTAECLEECDDLILWFSEGKYVYQAMELKMKYKPLTPLQQEKYNNKSGGSIKTQPEILDSGEESTVNEVLEEMEESLEVKKTAAITEPKVERKVNEESPIRKTVKGATLAEALANGVAVASGLDIEEKLSNERDEAMRITGQMKIEEILQEWEAKQKNNAEAIEVQKQKDDEVLAKKREEEEKRRQIEACRLEEQQRAAEEARKIAEQKEAEEARRQEELRKEEEARLAKEREEEARRLEKEKEEEEEKLLNKLATGGASTAATLDLSQVVSELEASEGVAKDEEAFDVEEEIQVVKDEALQKHQEIFEEEEDDYQESDYEEDYEDDDYEESEDDDYEEDDYQESDDDYEEDDYDEDDYEESDDDDTEEEDSYEESEEHDEDEFNLDLEEALVGETKEFLIEEPTEEEIQKRIKKGKTGVPFDTGFVVTGRYDLSATSEIGLKAGLTEEQKKLFSYFVPVRGMSEQIVAVLDNDRREQREGTSKTGNLLVVGRKGTGKTVLAVDIVKAIQKQRNLQQGKVAIVTGESLNKKDLNNIVQKLRGGAIIIERAGKMNTKTAQELNYLMEKKTGELLFVLEDQKKPLDRIFTANPSFKKKFTSTLELPVFINDELVTFGQTYAKENGYKLDEMGILALYSRIDVMQREDHAVTVAEVKEIMDEAIEHSQKANMKHLARRVFKKGTDESDRIILKEEDFKI